MKKTTAEIMVDALVANGVDTVFGIPGAHCYAFTDALARRGNDIRFLHTRHEQGAGYMAYGYARATGKPGVFTVVPGPGVLNAGAALATAHGASVPMLCLTGNIMSHLIGQGRGQLHELPDQLALLRGLTKHAERIDHPSGAAGAMTRAFTELSSGRPRPVAVEVPWDVFGTAGMTADCVAAETFAPALDAEAIEAAAEMVARARHPMIVVGAGALDAPGEVLALAERIQAPVMAHRSGKGVVDETGPYAMNVVAGWDWFERCDLLIGIGSRLEMPYLRWPQRPAGMKLLRIDIDPTEMVRLKPDLGIVADAGAATAALADALTGPRPASRIAEFDAARARAAARIAEIQPQMAWLEALRRALPRDGFLVEEVSQMGFVARFGFPVHAPRQYVTCGAQETLGFGYNTALGVKVACPDRPVVSISGDGGFLFGVQEMATAVQFGIGVVAVVFDNAAYGNVRRDQMQAFGGRVLGAELANPDFLGLATSFGMPASRAETPEALERQVRDALARGGPHLVHVPVETGSEASPWPLLHPQPR